MKIKNGQSAAKQIQMKSIPGWEDLYSITEKGEVYSHKRNKFLKSRESMDGYKRVALYREGLRREYRVARLVATTFLGKPNEGQQVNHKDYNRSNDFLENLEWVDPIDNINHSFDKNRYSIPKNYKAYTFTNVYNKKAFTIIGIKNVAKQFGCSSKNFKACITKYANTGKYVKQGYFKGLRIDSEYLKVQRLSEME
jgi:hypothetical protein